MIGRITINYLIVLMCLVTRTFYESTVQRIWLQLGLLKFITVACFISFLLYSQLQWWSLWWWQ